MITVVIYAEAAAGSNWTTPTFSAEPRDVVVARGQSAVLDCAVADQPPPTAPTSPAPASHYDVTWFQDGLSVVLTDSRRQILSNGSLYFNRVRIC